MHGNAGPTEGIEAPEDPRPEWWTQHEQAAAEGWASNPANPARDIGRALRDAALKAQAMEIRERLVASILNTLELNAIDGRDTGENEPDFDGIVVARYVTTLADALGQYIATGEVTKYPAENTEV